MPSKNTDAALGVKGRLENELLEQCRIDVRGAAAGQKEGLAGHFLDRQPVDLTVAFGSHGDIGSFFSKGGRIEDHQIIVERFRTEKIEGIGLENGMSQGIKVIAMG